MTKNDGGSLALLCDLQGMIIQVLRNDLSLNDAVPGHLFPRLVEQDNQFKALNFLNEINLHTTAFDWEINVFIEKTHLTLHFSGGRLDKQLLIVGATESNEALRHLYDDMLQINNEQTNLLRSTIKETANTKRNGSQYDEISRLNNELVSMQRDLAKKNAELAQLNKLKNQFLGMAAHDLRNPLQSISSYSELLRDESLTLSPQVRLEFLTDIDRLSQYMMKLVNDLLSVSAIESGQLRLELEPTNLSTLLQKNVAHNRFLAAQKQIEFSLETETLPLLLLDAEKIEQVLDNLLGNAIKFSHPGSQIQIRLYLQDSDVILAVKDQGIGIAPSEIDKLFKPFGRTSSKSTSGERSTGLGLMIVKRIVEGHHGTIWLESVLGKGTTFFIKLPTTSQEKKE